MGIETKKRKIGEHEYELTTFGARQAQRVLVRLIRILGPAAAEIASKGSAGVGSALTSACSNLSDDDLEYITAALAECTKVCLSGQTNNGGVPHYIPLAPLYDNHFAGQFDRWSVWLGWGVKENFQSFFSGTEVKEALQYLGIESASTSPTV